MPGFKTIVVPVRDLAAAKALYAAALDAEPHTDEPYYVGFNVDGCELGLNPAGFDQGATGPVAHLDVDDIDAAVASVTDAGGSVVQDPTDVGGGAQIAVVADADGNRFGFRSMA